MIDDEPWGAYVADAEIELVVRGGYGLLTVEQARALAAEITEAARRAEINRMNLAIDARIASRQEAT